MSDAEQNLVAWMSGQGMHDSAGLVERLMSERDALRAELAAEREYREDLYRESVRNMKAALKARAERDALRALLREAREDPDYRSLKGGLRARIDAALKGDGDDGNA